MHDGETLCFSLFCHCGMDILCGDVLVGFEEGSFLKELHMGKKEKTRIQWHPGFVAAMNLEFAEQRNEMIMEREHNLNLKPLEIDLLVIKKKGDLKVRNEIGHFFRGHNIVEYKSPDDTVNINVIYKCIAYAALYKSYGETMDCIKADDVTVTVICWAKPRKLFRYFADHEIEFEKKHPGIYAIERGLLFPLQIVVARELNKEEHVWLRALSKEMEREDYERLSKAVEELDETTNDEYVDSVLRVSIRANEKKLKEDKSMRFEALKELFEPELTEKWNDGRRKGAMAMANTMLLRGYHSDEIIDIIMQTFQLDRSEAVKYMKDLQKSQHR